MRATVKRLAFSRAGNFDGAQELIREALGGFQDTLGPEHPRTLGAKSELASILREQGALDEARRLYEEALSGQRATLGDCHPATLCSINNMASVLTDLGAEVLGSCHVAEHGTLLSKLGLLPLLLLPLV